MNLHASFCVRSTWVAALAALLAHSAPAAPAPYLDPSQPLPARIHDLISRLTLDEKASLMNNASPGVPRLGIPRYDWWNEALHGVANAGNATVFPQSIALASTWDVPLMRTVADTISTEARAKCDGAITRGDEVPFHGLTFWSPNINIFRDPRWGRGQETYGEDPYLTARLGMAFVRGLQGDDPRYLKVAACAKHFVVHSGPEPLRHIFDVHPDPVDLHETYFPAFEALVRAAHVEGVMTAYNAVDGQPCAVNTMLYRTLYHDWGFDGYVTSDCGAITDLFRSRGYAPDAAAAEAMAVKAGLCLTCGREAVALGDAVRRGLITEGEVDARLYQLLRTMFRLGIFDPPAEVPYDAIPSSENDTPAHAALALQAAREAIVLLKNDGILPLAPGRIHRVAIIGPDADSVPALLGNYHGIPSEPVTVLAGLKAALPSGTTVDYEPGCAYVDPAGGGKPEGTDPNTAPPHGGEDAESALAAARAADVVVFVAGYTAAFEGEEMRSVYDGFEGGDRTRIELAGPQERLLRAVEQTGTPVVLVLMTGGAVAVPWEDSHLAAILEAWYPGEEGGAALADVLLGRADPSGRLPVTFYRSTADLPPFADYSMANRTYRYFAGRPLYPFGFGLSYTHFEFGSAQARLVPGGGPGPDLFGPFAAVSVTVRNAGSRAGDEVVQVYADEPDGFPRRPRESLCGFARVHLGPGESASVEIPVAAFALRRWNPETNAYFIPKGTWTFRVGASSADIRARAMAELP